MGILFTAHELGDVVAADLLARASAPPPSRGWFRRSAAPVAVSADEIFALQDASPRFADLDKAWHGLAVLLGDDPGPILGGTSVTVDPDARILTAAEVRGAAATLATRPTASLRAGFDPALMAADGVYPAIWDEEDVFDEYLAPNYEALQDFYRTAADHGAAALLSLG